MFRPLQQTIAPGRVTSSGATPSGAGPCRRSSLLSNPIFHQMRGHDDTRSRQRIVLFRPWHGAWLFPVEVAILGASAVHKTPRVFRTRAQLAKSVRLTIFQRLFSRRLLSAPLYRRPFLRCRGPANLGSRSLCRFALSLCRQLLLPCPLLYRVCLSP